MKIKVNNEDKEKAKKIKKKVDSGDVSDLGMFDSFIFKQVYGVSIKDYYESKRN